MPAKSPNPPQDKDAAARTWAERLRRLAGLTFPDGVSTPCLNPAAFSDELGGRRSIDALILARVCGSPTGPAPTQATPDIAWWWALATGAPPPPAPADGPMTPRRDDQAIELWTEIELGALHAATSLAIDRDSPTLLARCLDACAWHVAEIEPDNATGHAWALHGFVLLALERGSAEADLHAQSLLHACMRGSGTPDRFSALLLFDAAAGLDRAAGRGPA